MRSDFLINLLFIIFASCSNPGKIENSYHNEAGETNKSQGIRFSEPEDFSVVSESGYYIGGDYEEGSFVRVFSGETVLRKDSSFNSDTIAVLAINTKVRILNCTKTDSLKSMHGLWQKVEYGDQQGFVWGPDLAVAALDISGKDTLFTMLYGITGVRDNFLHTGKAILVRGDTVLQELDADPIEISEGDNSWYGYDVRGLLWENKGFTGVRNLIGLECTYGACGYDNGYILFLWDGEKLYRGPSVLSMSDADVAYKIPYVYFPADSSGLKDEIVIKTVSGEDVEENSVFKETVSAEVWKWTPGVGLLLKK